MPHILALAVQIVATALAVAGMGYFLAAIVAARAYLRARRKGLAAMAAAGADAPAPGISILKSLKGIDPGMLDAFRSHCRQNYRGEFELIFGVASLAEPAAAAVQLLQQEFPRIPIRLLECPLRLGVNGKVSTLAQMAGHARHEILLFNDSDISVSPRYLERVAAAFGLDAAVSAGTALDRATGHSLRRPVGMVTALYHGRAHRSIFRGGLPEQLEALGIATDFIPGVLLSRLLEGGLHYGLGSTLAVRREALQAAGGLMPLADLLADDHELGASIARAGYRIELCAEVVETSVPAYSWRGFTDHQLRWLRTVRDARPAGYAGLIFTYGLGWALLNVLASGASLLSFWLLALSFFLRLALAMTAGAEVLHDRDVLPHLWLVPLRDVVAMGLWVAGFASHSIVWRGERFVLQNGKLEKLGSTPQRTEGST
jgi:ceramide glucosyltransferase